MAKPQIEILQLLRVTAGKRHGWYEARITDKKGKVSTIEVRKPLLEIVR